MQTLHDLFRSRGSRLAVVDLRTGASIDYEALANRVVRIGMWLSGRGLSRGDAVIQRLPNSLEALCFLLACLDRGLACAPLSAQATEAEARLWAGLTGARLAVLSRWQSDAAADAFAEIMPVTRIETDGVFGWLPEVGEAGGTGDGQLLIRTSGSTGDPKVVVQTAAALRSCAAAFARQTGAFEGDTRILAAAPMCRLSGLFNVGLLPLEAGATVVIGGEVAAQSPAKLWHDIARAEADLIWLAPSTLRTLARAKPLRPLRAVLAGMAPLSPDEKAAFAAHVGAPVYENYGLSETLFLTAAGTGAPDAGGVGQPLPGVELMLKPPVEAAEGWAAGDGASAEICVRTPFLFAGYRQADGALAAPTLDADAAFRTGDLGRRAPDGALRVDGRLKAMLKRGPEPVFLPEIEALSRTIPGVGDAAAVPMTHRPYVESYTLLIRPRGDGDPKTLADKVRLALAGRIERDAWPDDIRVVDDDFPLLPGGKPDYQALKAALARL